MRAGILEWRLLAALLAAREDQPDCLVRFSGASPRMSQCSAGEAISYLSRPQAACTQAADWWSTAAPCGEAGLCMRTC